MKRFQTLVMEREMSKLEQTVEYNLSERGVHPVSLGELLDLAQRDRARGAAGVIRGTQTAFRGGEMQFVSPQTASPQAVSRSGPEKASDTISPCMSWRSLAARTAMGRLRVGSRAG